MQRGATFCNKGGMKWVPGFMEPKRAGIMICRAAATARHGCTGCNPSNRSLHAWWTCLLARAPRPALGESQPLQGRGGLRPARLQARAAASCAAGGLFRPCEPVERGQLEQFE